MENEYVFILLPVKTIFIFYLSNLRSPFLVLLIEGASFCFGCCNYNFWSL